MCLLSAMCSAEELLAPYSRYFCYPAACTQAGAATCKGTRCDEGHGEGERCSTMKLQRSSHRPRNGGQKAQHVPKQNKSPRLIATHLFFYFILSLLRQSSSLQAAEDLAALLLGNTLQLKTIGEKSLPSFHDQLLCFGA